MLLIEFGYNINLEPTFKSSSKYNQGHNQGLIPTRFQNIYFSNGSWFQSVPELRPNSEQVFRNRNKSGCLPNTRSK
jgi:hypothetical protein